MRATTSDREIDRLRDALDAAALSLGALSCAGSRHGSDLLNDMIAVRGYAASRAAAARAALEGKR